MPWRSAGNAPSTEQERRPGPGLSVEDADPGARMSLQAISRERGVDACPLKRWCAGSGGSAFPRVDGDATRLVTVLVAADQPEASADDAGRQIARRHLHQASSTASDAARAVGVEHARVASLDGTMPGLPTPGTVTSAPGAAAAWIESARDTAIAASAS